MSGAAGYLRPLLTAYAVPAACGVVLALLAAAAALFCGYQWQSTEQDLEKARASYEDKQDELDRMEEELETGLQEELEAAQAELESTRSELESTRADLEQAQAELERAGELSDLFGYGSDTYYTTTPVLILEAGGSDGTVPIYFGKEGTVRFSESGDGIDGRWSTEWEDNWTDVLVTPGAAAGYYTLHFSNDEDSAEFDVLVVVR